MSRSLSLITRLSIEHAVTDGLTDLCSRYIVFARQIGDSARDPEHAVIGTGGQTKAVHDLFQQVAAFAVDRAHRC